MTPLERDVESKLRKTVESHGGLCLKWVSPSSAGVPDRIILMPGGRVVFVETKRPKGGVLSKRQGWWRNKLTELGFAYWTVWGYADIKALEAIELC